MCLLLLALCTFVAGLGRYRDLRNLDFQERPRMVHDILGHRCYQGSDSRESMPKIAPALQCGRQCWVGPDSAVPTRRTSRTLRCLNIHRVKTWWARFVVTLRLSGGASKPWEIAPVTPDYYQALGVPLDATVDVIRSNFKKLVLKYHPDKNQDDPEAAKAKF